MPALIKVDCCKAATMQRAGSGDRLPPVHHLLGWRGSGPSHSGRLPAAPTRVHPSGQLIVAGIPPVNVRWWGTY